MLDPLYIGEPNTVYVVIGDVTDASPTFSIKDAEGDDVGTPDVAMTYDPVFVPDPCKPTQTIAAYVGTYPHTDAALLTESDPNDPATLYYVWIEAAGYTLRKLERAAQYRGES